MAPGGRRASRGDAPALGLRGVPDPRATVVVLAFNGGDLLTDCLEAVLSQELEGAFEVLVVDNGSTDGSAERVRRRFPEIRVEAAGRNLGFAAGNNLGLRLAAGVHPVLLNQDTRVRAGWLAALVAAAEAGEGVGAVTSKLVFADRPAVVQNAGCLLLSDGGGADRGSGEPDDGRYDRPEEVFGFCGAAALLSRQMLADVGDFDADFFNYYEDLDLSWRMRLRGWRILYEPAAVVEHAHAASAGEWSEFFVYHADRNRLFTLTKNAGAGFALASLRQLAGRSRGGGGAPAAAGVRRRLRGRVLRSYLAHLPALLVKRAAIRLRRRVGDAEIQRWLHPRELWDARSA
jgi:GT2 family glycosyltransferase